MKISKKQILSVEESIYSVGIELSIISSLVNFLDVAINDKLQISNIDISNLTILLKEKINNVKDKYDSIEYSLGL